MRRAPTAVRHDTRGGTLTESWYRALDHRAVDVGMQSWVLQVVAIHPEGAELWIQVANDDAPYEGLVLHVSRWTTLAQALAARNLELEEVFPDPKYARRFVDSMPSADVCVSLITAAHRNPQTRWTGNDMFDIDALSVAVPYCDIVVTERHARHALEVAGAPDRAGTAVMATLEGLAAAIS